MKCCWSRPVQGSSQQRNESNNLYKPIEGHQWPIVYRSEYNINLMGIEKLHPFDAKKWGHIFKFLKDEGMLNEGSIVLPNKAKASDLLVAHSEDYLSSLTWSHRIAQITEIWPVLFLPNRLLQKCYLKPMRYQTGGSVLAGRLALERGWAINLGGGFHHCSRDKGGGFCPYADISLLVQFLLQYEANRVSRVMIVDLDAHQGNGYAKDFINMPNVYILDVYNSSIYPRDLEAKRGIRRKVELSPFTDDEEYLEEVERNLEDAFSEFYPDIMVYNAGTDILDGDSLGRLKVSARGVIRRDEIVFMKARSRRVPIVMLTSGGYLPITARIVADSILNLLDVGLISDPPSVRNSKVEAVTKPP